MTARNAVDISDEAQIMSAFGGKADIGQTARDVR
jgi:hypothetical protein